MAKPGEVGEVSMTVAVIALDRSIFVGVGVPVKVDPRGFSVVDVCKLGNDMEPYKGIITQFGITSFVTSCLYPW